MSTKQLDKLATEVADERACVAREKVIEATLRSLVDTSPEHVLWMSARTRRKESEEHLKDLEIGLREALIDNYDGETKHPAAHSYPVRKVLEYDVKAAIEHCAEHLRGALGLNKRKFETVARVSADDLDFVTLTEVPGVTIKSDLGKFSTDLADIPFSWT